MSRWLTSQSLDSHILTDFKGFIANHPGSGDVFTISAKRRVRDLFQFRLSGYEVVLQQHHEYWGHKVKQSELNGAWVPTTTAIVHGVTTDRFPYIERLVHDLCRLLTFTSLSGVHMYGYEYPSGSGKQKWWSSRGQYRRSWPLFWNLADASLTDFVTQVWPRYRILLPRHRLGVVASYLAEGERLDQPMEIKLACAFLALESLKESFARHAGLPFHRGRFRDPSSGKTPSKSRPLGFDDLIQRMFRSVGMRRGTQRVVKPRNEIIHTSVSSLPLRSQYRLYSTVVRLCEEYLARLLGYSGAFRAHGGGIRHL
jgi:hypothetical protein